MIKLGTKSDPARLLIGRADAARDEKRYSDAATLYAEALRISPKRAGIHVQAGHMFKEAGLFEPAEHHYREAQRMMPNDSDLALQLGHFFKRSGRLPEAADAYARAVELRPDWSDAVDEKQRLHEILSHAEPGGEATSDADMASDAAAQQFADRPEGLRLARLYGKMAPENLPKPFEAMLHYSADSVNLRQFGVGMNTYWGMKPVLRGIEAIRGFAISTTELDKIEARINGLPFHHGPLKGPYELEYEPDRSRIHKYVFNIWHDFSGFAPGLYELELVFTSSSTVTQRLAQQFVIEPPLLEADHPECDGIINLPPDGIGSLDDRINARPSKIHEAERPNMLPEVRSILVTRADQLGDLVASVPGILRLRELFPDAKIVGVFSPANVDLARTLKVFDDIVILDFRESLYQRTRTLTLEQQARFRDQLKPYKFDLAIDLSQSLMSRPLLGLSGAPFTYGFKDPNWPRLSASVDDAYYDPKNHREIATHSTRILTMIDRLGALMKGASRIIRRDDLPRSLLHRYGIADQDRFVTVHTGARIVFSRWPHYMELVDKLHDDTDLKIVLFTGDAELRSKLSPAIRDSDRIIVLDQQLPFDEFDALLSYCTLYIGNDSGPKHLASLRGVPVVSIHSARINWSEWGQEHTGVIVTRKVPCAGCTLYHDVDECGKDYVCINGIPLDDVYNAVRRYV